MTCEATARVGSDWPIHVPMLKQQELDAYGTDPEARTPLLHG